MIDGQYGLKFWIHRPPIEMAGERMEMYLNYKKHFFKLIFFKSKSLKKKIEIIKNK